MLVLVLLDMKPVGFITVDVDFTCLMILRSMAIGIESIEWLNAAHHPM